MINLEVGITYVNGHGDHILIEGLTPTTYGRNENTFKGRVINKTPNSSMWVGDVYNYYPNGVFCSDYAGSKNCIVAKLRSNRTAKEIAVLKKTAGKFKLIDFVSIA